MPQSLFSGTMASVANERIFAVGAFTPPPPTTITRPWFGISNPDGLTGFDRTQDVIVGHDFDVHRVFSSGWTSNPTTLLQPEISAGRIPVWSFKPPTSNVAASYATLAANLQALGGLILVAVDHEPENSMTAAEFEANHLDMVAGLGHLTNVWLGPIYMAVTATSSTRADFRDLLDTMPFDFIGVDGYNSQNKRTFTQIFNWFAVKARSRNVPWAVCEWGAHGTPTQRAAHILSGRTYWENPTNADLVIVSWFDSDGGNNAGPSGWRLERALPDNWAVIDGISQAVSPPPEYVEDLLTPGAVFDALQTPRRNVGPIDPPPPPPVPLQRGSLTIGTAEYPIPPGALYVAPGGSDGAGGTIGAPKATIGSAANTAGCQAVVLRAGTYRSSTFLPSRELIIQNYPGEAVWLDGSDVITGWIQDNTGPGGTDRWKRSGFTSGFSRAASGQWIDPAYPEAIWPEQIWIDGVPLEQVSTLADVGTTVEEPGAPGTFWYDVPNNRLWIGATPFNKTVEVTVRQIALSASQSPTSNPPKLTVRGIGIKHYGTSPSQLGAVHFFGNSSLAENCEFVGNSGSGLFISEASGAQIRLNTFTENGQLGWRCTKSPFLLIEQNDMQLNNRKRFATIGAAGGGKLDTDSVGAVVRNNYCEKNWGHAIWLDLYSHYALVIGNEIYDHALGAGIHYENCVGGAIAGNWIKGCIHGILGSQSANVEVWNNTLVDNTNPLIYQLYVDNPTYMTYRARNNIVSQRVNYSAQAVYTGVDAAGNIRDWMEMEWSVDNNAVWMKFAQIYARLTVPGNTQATYATQAALLAATNGIDDNTISTSGGTVDPYLNTGDKLPKPPCEGTGTMPPQLVIDAMVAAGIWTVAQTLLPPNIGAY